MAMLNNQMVYLNIPFFWSFQRGCGSDLSTRKWIDIVCITIPGAMFLTQSNWGDVWIMYMCHYN